MSIAAATDADGGNVDTALKVEGGKVVLAYHQPVRLVLFDPQNALQLAHGLARASYEARFGRAPADEGHNLLAQQVRSTVTRELRDRMISRVKLSLTSLQEQHRHPDYIATELVDIVLSGTK